MNYKLYLVNLILILFLRDFTVLGIILLLAILMTEIELFIQERGNHCYCYNTQSQTTRKHIREFFKQHNLSDKQIKELMKEGHLEVTYE